MAEKGILDKCSPVNKSMILCGIYTSFCVLFELCGICCKYVAILLTSFWCGIWIFGDGNENHYSKCLCVQ